MQENYLFEYAVIRVVPRVEREEFINVGVILICIKQKFLKCKINLNETKLFALYSLADSLELTQNLKSFENICNGDIEKGGLLAKLDISSRFRWLTATRSTVVQCSKVHPGMCNDLEKLLERLFEEMVI